MKYFFLILGSKGQLGSNLHKFLKLNKKFKVETVAKKNAHHNFNLENFDKLKKLIKYKNYNYIVNCAAHTNLDYCEKNFKKIFKINSLLPKHLSEWSKNYNFKLVHISTDHIYLNNKNKYNSEKSRIGWFNKYSKSKYLAEKNIKRDSNSLIIRTNFMDNKKNKKSFLYWLNNCVKLKKEIPLFTDMYTSTIDIQNLIKILVKLMIKNFHGIYNVGSRNKISKAEFGMIYLKKIKAKPIIKFVKTNHNLSKNIRRGRFLGLDVTKIEKRLNMKMPNTKKVINNLI
tara:strand:- start:20936 stop:21790 length:855 start_codon:yes stop_codon:yes gene_type:complete